LTRYARDAEAAGLGVFDYRVEFCPHYSPMLNPIEPCWHHFKIEARRQFDGPMHERVLGIVHAGWGNQTGERAAIMNDVFEIAKLEITQARVAAHERHSVSLFRKASAREDL
jgi:hypothetical protein